MLVMPASLDMFLKREMVSINVLRMDGCYCMPAGFHAQALLRPAQAER